MKSNKVKKKCQEELYFTLFYLFLNLKIKVSVPTNRQIVIEKMLTKFYSPWNYLFKV